MRIFKGIVLLVCMGILCSGCIVASMNPFYTKQNIVDVPEINGKWMKVEEQEDSKTEVNKDEIMVIRDDTLHLLKKNGDVEESYTVEFFKVNGQLFMDFSSKINAVLAKPLHSLCKVDYRGNNILIISLLDADWFNKLTASGEISFPYIISVDGQYEYKTGAFEGTRKPYIYMAKSGDWTWFLEKYGANAEAFGQRNVFHRVLPEKEKRNRGLWDR